MITIKNNKNNVKIYTETILTTTKRSISVKDKLKNLKSDRSLSTEEKNAVSFLHQNIVKIISSDPNKLEDLINEIILKNYHQIIFDSSINELTEFGNKIKDIFNYESFRTSKKAILLTEMLNIKTCTYCNTQYTLNVKHDKKTKMLFHLDHFFPKSVYPYLSLSFYNLIPCCASCNMSKSNKPFKLSENIHPYLENLNEIAKYEADASSLIKFLLNTNNNDISIQLKIRAKYLGDTKMEKKLENYRNEFKVESQYQQFKDVIGETYLKGLYYNKFRKNEIIDFFKNTKGIVLNDEMIRRFIIGNYTEEKDLLKRPLAKMMKDISEDFKLI